MSYVIRHLRDAGRARWEAIAAINGLSKSTPKKIVYGEMPKFGPGILKIQPLFDYFQAIDRGDVKLPDPVEAQV